MGLEKVIEKHSLIHSQSWSVLFFLTMLQEKTKVAVSFFAAWATVQFLMAFLLFSWEVRNFALRT